MAVLVIYHILCLSVILCRGTLLHNSGSCQIDACQKQQYAALEQRIRALESKQTSYAFMAQTRILLAHPEEGHQMVFENVIANVGSAYNKHTGTFLVPVSGTYAFSYHLTARPVAGHFLRVYLKQNVNIIGHGICEQDDAYEMCGDQSVVHANVGDEIYVALHVSGDNVIQTGQMESHFQGFLIHQD